MKRAAQIFFLDQLRQGVVLSRLELAAVFPELWRNVIKIDSVIEFDLVTNLRYGRYRFCDRPSGSDLCLRIGRQRREAIFIQGPAAFKRAAAQLDVVLLVPGKIDEGERILRRGDDA